MIKAEGYNHFHKLYFMVGYAFCQCGQVFIKDGTRYREMTVLEEKIFERGIKCFGEVEI
jgi:hypothetical protein